MLQNVLPDESSEYDHTVGYRGHVASRITDFRRSQTILGAYHADASNACLEAEQRTYCRAG